MHKNKILTQRGAMFGLDARIALYVFGVIGAIGTGITLAGIFEYKAQGLADELNNYKIAIEGTMQDLDDDLIYALDSPSDANEEAIIALWDSSELKAAFQPKWLGPYVTYQQDTHREYGNIRLYKYQTDTSTACNGSATCYYWLSYSAVPIDVVEELNEIFDGQGEGSASTSGVIRWTGSSGDVPIFFKISRAPRI